MKIQDAEVVWIARDLNGHVGEGNLDTEVTEEYGVGARKKEETGLWTLQQQKYRGGHEELHCIFNDLEKVYDRDPRQGVWNCLQLKEVEEKYIRLVYDMYEGSKTLVRWAAGDTEEFETTLRWVQRQEEVEQRLELWREAMEVRGMKVSRKKTEYLKMKADDGEEGQEKERMKLLNKWKGSTVQADGGSEREVTKRIQAGWGSWKKITGVMCDRKVSDAVKGRMYKTMMRQAMVYGTEAVAVTKAQEGYCLELARSLHRIPSREGRSTQPSVLNMNVQHLFSREDRERTLAIASEVQRYPTPSLRSRSKKPHLWLDVPKMTSLINISRSREPPTFPICIETKGSEALRILKKGNFEASVSKPTHAWVLEGKVSRRFETP
ncbi:uncharacterized protein LOC134769654 [Penaeus indicus]|uniref:uncharacterized protein LOC134769654 n=1 Tax=Penaeus indicus TaxID=29960 RepID=UPI00300C9EF9